MINHIKPSSTFTKLEKNIFIALQEFFNQKNLLLSEENISSSISILKTKSILVKSLPENYYDFNYSSDIFNKVVLYFAEKILKREAPTDILKTYRFVEDFLYQIRLPKPSTHWYNTNFKIAFRNYLYIKFDKKICNDLPFLLDILKYDWQIDGEDNAKDTLKNNIKYTIPFLSLTAEQVFQVALTYKSIKYGNHNAIDILRKVSSLDEAKSIKLYDLCIENRDIIKGNNLIRAVITGLSSHNCQKAIQRIDELKLDVDFSEELIGLFGWLEYSSPSEIEQVFKIVRDDSAFAKNRLISYCRLINSSITTRNQKNEIFSELKSCLEESDKTEIKDALHWIGRIKGFEKEKFEFILIFNDKGIQIDFRDYFSEFSNPGYLFGLIKGYYNSLKKQAQISPFSSALNQLHHKDANTFEIELINAISDNYAIVRKAGFDILTSPQSNNNYKANLLLLDEKRQLIAIDSLLTIPLSIERTFPIVIALRNSPFPSVQESLYKHLVMLAFAFMGNFIDLLKKHLDTSNAQDLILLTDFESLWKSYYQTILEKSAIKELNPLLSQRSLADKFYRKEKEHQVEQMDAVNKDRNSFHNIFKNIQIIRGCGFYSESNPRIAKLNKIEMKHLIDSRMFQNSDLYNQTFHYHFFEKNYQ